MKLTVDLKVWDKWYFLVIVELDTIVCATIEVYNKLSPTIIKGLFKMSMFQRNLCRLMEGTSTIMKFVTPAANIPRSNGVYERLNTVIENMVGRIISNIMWKLISVSGCNDLRNHY